MSTNLHLNAGKNGPPVELWQTPTWVTYMCMSYNNKGKPDGGMEGVMRRYIMWVESHPEQRTDGWKREDLEYLWDRIKEHVSQLKELKNPHFSAW